MPQSQPQPTWLESLWNLPVFRWLSGLDGPAIVPPPEVTLAAPPPPPCSVQPLAAIDDQDAVLMETNDSGANLNLTGLTPRTAVALSRFESIVQSRGGSFSLQSAYRPAAYQAHLRDVWFKWVYELRDNTDPACADLKADVSFEFGRHRLLVSQYPVTVSDHTLGIGFDATVEFPALAGKRARRRRVSIDRIARLSGVVRPDIRRDPVHFRLIGGRG